MTLKDQKKPELLSPCGSFESLLAALRCGADAVYVGGKLFSARRNAKNFSKEELAQAVILCHKYGAKIYQAINTCVLDSELNDLAEEIKSAADMGIDGLITQDAAVEYIVKTACPDMPIHASTQLTLHTESGLSWAKMRGFSRAVLSRELPKEVIARLSCLGIETEIFVHGALCMSVSGQCYLSALIGTRSANRGLCAGACRLPFSAKGKAQDKYALSLKDASLAHKAEEISSLGVSSLKIEGRMKRPEYVAASTYSFRQALDGLEFDTEALRAVFSRSGFTDGYYSRNTGRSMFGARSKEDVASAQEILPKLRELYRREPGKFPVSFSFCAHLGEQCRLTAVSCDETVTVFGDAPEVAVNRPTEADTVKTQLAKCGGSLYYFENADIDIDSGLMIPLSIINSMRRDALSALDEKRIQRLTKVKPFDCSGLMLMRPKTLNLKYPQLLPKVEKVSQLSLLDISKLPAVIIPLSSAKEYIDMGYPAEKAILSLPRFTFDESLIVEELKKAKAIGFKTVECTNPAHILIARSLDLNAFGGFGLNITNSISAWEYSEQGLCALTLSFELTAHQAGAIAAPMPTGAILYGRLPLMLTVNCPISSEVGCKNCTHSLTDRTGAEFPILCKKSLGYYELLNSKVMILSDKLRDFNLDFGILMFTLETPEEVSAVFKNYLSEEKPTKDFTRGLYYRGIE